jgi:hypothetical protein
MAAYKSIAENDIDILMALLCRLCENTILIFKNYKAAFEQIWAEPTVEMGQNLPKKGHGEHPEPRAALTLGKNP